MAIFKKVGKEEFTKIKAEMTTRWGYWYQKRESQTRCHKKSRSLFSFPLKWFQKEEGWHYITLTITVLLILNFIESCKGLFYWGIPEILSVSESLEVCGKSKKFIVLCRLFVLERTSTSYIFEQFSQCPSTQLSSCFCPRPTKKDNRKTQCLSLGFIEHRNPLPTDQLRCDNFGNFWSMAFFSPKC